MSVICARFDPDSVPWRRVTDARFHAFRVDFEYSLLGYDLPSGRLDMLLRYGPGGHCRPHRHIATTATLVLAGEQCLREYLPDGGTREIRRRAGDYALAPADALRHDEWGGPEGGTVLLSMTARDGLLFEYFDPAGQGDLVLDLGAYVRAWETGAVYGPAAAGA